LRRNEDTAIRVRSTYERILAPGDAVFDEGDPGDHLYVIQAGEIELTREGAEGLRVVARLGPGDFFGEISVVAGQLRSARAVAVKQTRLLELDRATLEAMCLAQPEIAIRMIRILVSRLVEAERRLAMLGVDDLLRPVVRALVRSAEPAAKNGGSGFRISGTLRNLAEQAGLSMLEAHRALHQLLDRKLLHLAEDRLEVPDLEALAGCLDRPA
jgi:CRP/FNR family cyclic AMP-dependent transcriptional regulator